jgi:fatty acid CoA ligase FadD9
MDRMMIWQTLCNGGRIGFVSPHYDMARLYADAQALQPVLMVAMPDFWNGLFTEFGNRFVAALAKVPKTAPPTVIEQTRAAVLKEVAGLLGGRVVATGTGGAKISSAVLSFMEQCFGSKPTNAFGTTEASGISSNGLLNPGVKLKLVSCEDVKYTTDGTDSVACALRC